MSEPIVSRQQRLILMASLIDADVDLDLVKAMGQFYALFLQFGYLNIPEICAKTDLSRDVVRNRVDRLTELGYLEKENYRAWRLNVEQILALNKQRSKA